VNNWERKKNKKKVSMDKEWWLCQCIIGLKTRAVLSEKILKKK